MDEKDILQAISELVAAAMDKEDLSGIEAALDAILPQDWTGGQKKAAFGSSFVYALVAEQPGYPDTGEPGYLASGTDLKAAVLHEIDAMLAADFDRGDHKKVWQKIQESVAATPEADFLPGVTVNCPDDYLLTLDKLSCADVLRQKNALAAWA